MIFSVTDILSTLEFGIKAVLMLFNNKILTLNFGDEQTDPRACS